MKMMYILPKVTQLESTRTKIQLRFSESKVSTLPDCLVKPKYNVGKKEYNVKIHNQSKRILNL